MWLMLQQSEPSDYVVGTGTAHSVRDFAKLAFQVVNLNYEDWVVQDPKLTRPAEVDSLLGDPTRAEQELKWSRKVSFESLVEKMVLADLDRYKAAGFGKTIPLTKRSKSVANL